MNSTIIFGIFIILAGAGVTTLGVYDARHARKLEAEKWQIVCSADGRWSFTDYSAHVHLADWGTRPEAEAAMVRLKAWSADYEANQMARARSEDAAKVAHAARFKPCP